MEGTKATEFKDALEGSEDRTDAGLEADLKGSEERTGACLKADLESSEGRTGGSESYVHGEFLRSPDGECGGRGGVCGEYLRSPDGVMEDELESQVHDSDWIDNRKSGRWGWALNVGAAHVEEGELDARNGQVHCVGSVHVDEEIIKSDHACHPHAPSSSVSVARECGGVSSVGGSLVGVGGAPGWSVGRLSARLSSRWCCPGCGLYGDGTLCMKCDMHGVGNSCTDSVLNLRLERSRERRGGTKTLKASTGIKVGSRFLDKPSGDASLADYLRSAPASWPVEAWECRTIVYPRVVKEVCLLAGGCEVVSARLPQSERYPVSPGPGELLRSGLGWTPLLRSPSSGVWVFRGAVQGEGSS